VLAAGAGERLRPFIHQLTGNTLPKQYVNIIGTRSMLEHTFHRAEKLIPRERLFTVVSQHHLDYREVRRQLSSRPTKNVVVQPEDRGTLPGILLPLMHLYKRYPDSTVAVFPSDHFILEEDLFIAYVGLAFQAVESDPSSLVLLGIEPDGPEPEYGYILPDGKVGDLAPLGFSRVQLFIEKPGPAVAEQLVMGGGLWNTMVLVFRTDTVLDLIRRMTPTLYDCFQEILKAAGTRKERYVVEEAYRHMKPVNFSQGVLEALALVRPSCLSVLPISEVFWSDWGSEHRIVSALKKTGYADRLQGILESGLIGI
jgi:mannose-1-phosphate guanylyltransferase